MAKSSLTTVIQLRRGTSAQWEQVKDTFTPAAGEPTVVLDGDKLGQVKIGDGSKTWSELPFVGTPVLNESIVAEYAVGGIKQGDTFSAGTSIESILRKLLINNIPEEDTTVLFGASTTVPTSIAGLTSQTCNVNTLINDGLVKTIKTGDESTSTPQYTIIACENDLELKDWRNNATQISYMTSVTKVVSGDYKIYYKSPTNYDADLGGEEYKFFFEEADE